MANKGYSRPTISGGYKHYDNNGHKTGHSSRRTFGGYTHYDAKGRVTGRSDPGFLGGYTHYDARGKKTGSTRQGSFGSYNHYNANGSKTGGSLRGSFGGYNHNDTGGCYVATCVYGSYDCPEVWALRRFRDNTLSKTLPGRVFIRMYYTVSPAIVRLFGGTCWFRNLWRAPLDKLVKKLRVNGVEDTPYSDPKW